METHFSRLVADIKMSWDNMGSVYRGIGTPFANSVRDSKRGEVRARLRAPVMKTWKKLAYSFGSLGAGSTLPGSPDVHYLFLCRRDEAPY